MYIMALHELTAYLNIIPRWHLFDLCTCVERIVQVWKRMGGSRVQADPLPTFRFAKSVTETYVSKGQTFKALFCGIPFQWGCLVSVLYLNIMGTWNSSICTPLHLHIMGTKDSSNHTLSGFWTGGAVGNTWVDAVLNHNITSLGLYSLRRKGLIGIGTPILKLKRSSDRLRFIIGFLNP